MSKFYTMVLQIVINVIKLSNSKILDPTEHALWRMLEECTINETSHTVSVVLVLLQFI